MNDQNIYDKPRHKQPCPPHKILPRNSKETLREMITKNETETRLLSLLKLLAIRPKGPWRDYLKFYQENQSGDTDTFKSEIKKYVAKMMKDLESEWERQQTDTTEPETKKDK